MTTYNTIPPYRDYSLRYTLMAVLMQHDIYKYG